MIGGAGGNAFLSRINVNIIPSERVLRGAGRALGYRLAEGTYGEASRGRVRGCEEALKRLHKVTLMLG